MIIRYLKKLLYSDLSNAKECDIKESGGCLIFFLLFRDGT